MTTEEKQKLEKIAYGKEPWWAARDLQTYLKTVSTEEPPKGKRTSPQNRALHLDCKLIAEKLNDAGLDMRQLIKQEINIPWTTENVKEYLWKPIMKALYQKESTTELEKASGEIEHIHNVLMRELGEKHRIEDHPFPHEEQRGVRLTAMENANRTDYPDDYEEPSF